MNRTRRFRAGGALLVWAVTCACIIAAQSSWAATPADSDKALALRVGKVITSDANDTVINNAVVLVRNGKIERIARQSELAVPAGYRVIDAKDKWLVPGIVDAHTHIVAGYDMWYMDLNDTVYLTNPGLRALEAIVPENDMLKDARSGGITTVLMIPGSGSNMGGFGTIAKTAGATVDDMVLREPGVLKIAQAGNPEWYWYGVGRSFMYYNLRQTLLKAKDYHDTWTAFEKGETTEKPPFNPIWQDFRGVFTRAYPAAVHTQAYQLVMSTIDMLANKLEMDTVLDHSTFDGYKAAELAVESGVYTINGPRQYFFDYSERRMYGNAARWWQGGVRKLGINTDAPVIPIEQLPYQAAMACWYGWLPYPALVGLTRVPAESLSVGEDVGSIEVGKDADLGIWTGDPVDPRSSCEMTIINGKIVYDASVKRRF